VKAFQIGIVIARKPAQNNCLSIAGLCHGASNLPRARFACLKGSPPNRNGRLPGGVGSPAFISILLIFKAFLAKLFWPGLYYNIPLLIEPMGNLRIR